MGLEEFDSILRIAKDGSHDSALKQLKLQFRNKIPKQIFTGDEIEGEEGASMEVALIDVSTGDLVKVGPAASEMVEIVLMKGEADAYKEDDWTAEEFEENIVQDSEGKNSLLSGTKRIKLHKGIGVMKKIKFTHGASERNPLPEFCLGARVVDMVNRYRIKEAMTNCFAVKNYRGKRFQKNLTPSLTDAVYRLKNIRRGGVIDKRLQDNGIQTVEHFLIRHLRDPKGLKSIVGNIGMVPKKWNDVIKHARACKEERIYCYTDSQQKTLFVFNIRGEVLPMHPNTTMNMALENHEIEARIAAACEHWEDLKPFDNRNSLDEHINGLTKAWDAMDSQDQNVQNFGYSSPSRGLCVDDYLKLNGELMEDDKCNTFHSSNMEAMVHDYERTLASELQVALQNVGNRHPLENISVLNC